VNNDPNKFLYHNYLDWGVSNNNGNLRNTTFQVGNAVPQSLFTTFTESFTYDGANRITGASDSGGWSRAFGYDRYGNSSVASNSGLGLSPAAPTSNVYNANNQNVSQQYDAAGNQTSFANFYNFAYDAENRLTSEQNYMGGLSATYAYDGEGHRVRKVAGANTTIYVYDALGQLASEYSSGAAGTPPCQTCYLTSDHLGSTRMVTDQMGSVVARHDYLPFGEEILGGTLGRSSALGFGAADQVNQKFTGKERDQETGLDFFQARYYGGALGRFTSPDPANAGANPADPQSWNAYAYVDNSPLVFTDPSGMNLFTSLWNGISNWFAGGGDELARCESFSDSGSCGSSSSGANPYPGAGGFMFSATGLGKRDVPTVNSPFTGGLNQAPSKSGCPAGPSKIISVAATTNVPTIAAGAVIGGAIGGPTGAFVGGIAGSLFGVGGNVSYVPSTNSWYAGPTAVFAPGLGGGNGISANFVNVPSTQNANSIANGASYSITFQPNPFFGSVVTKSPGSGPPVVGPSIGTRVPVSFGAGYNFCLHNCGC